MTEHLGKGMRASWAFLAVFLIGPAVPVLGGETSSPEATVRGAYAAYGSGDPAIVQRISTPGAPAIPTLSKAITRRCWFVQSVVIDAREITGDHATVTATALVTKPGKDGSPERNRTEGTTVQLHRSGGRWLIDRWAPVEEPFIDRLIAAAEPQRRLLLASNEAFLSPEAGRLLAMRAWEATNHNRATAESLNALASDLAGRIGDPGAQALVLGIQAIFRRDDGASEEALRLCRESLALAQRSGDPDVLARALTNMGRALWNRDAFSTEAFALFAQVSALEHEVDDQTIICRALINLGNLYTNRADYFSARATYERALQIARSEGDRVGITACENNLADTYDLEGEHDLQSLHLRAALATSASSYYEPILWAQLADSYTQAGRLADAAKTLKRATRIAKVVGGDMNWANVYDGFGHLYMKEHKYGKAEKAFLMSDSLYARHSESDQFDSGAEAALKNGDSTTALSLARSAAEAARHKSSYRFVEEQVMVGRALRAQSDKDGAVAALSEAVTESEAYRDRFAGEVRPQTDLFEHYTDAYAELSDLLIELNRPADALRISEMQKGRALLEIARNGRHDISKSMSVEEKDEERRLAEVLSALNRRLADAESEAEATGIRPELANAQLEYEQFEARLFARHPQLRTMRGSPSIPDTAAMAASLPPGAAYIEYSLAPDSLDVFVLSRGADGSPRLIAKRRLIDREQLRTLAGRYQEKLSRREGSYRADGRALFNIVIAPILAGLSGIHHLSIIPADALWRIPFESLVDRQGRFLIERFSVSYAPSIAVRLAGHELKPSNNPILTCGDPVIESGTRKQLQAFYRGMSLGRLPDAADEATVVARMYGTGSKRLIGTDATKAEVKAIASNYGILHFATHAILDDRNPMYSRLLLAADPSSGEDGMLQSWEIMNLDLNASLVVLSACDTARGRVGAGEGVVGMAWAFFVAGAHSTIASQWAVASLATRDLMVDFHAALRNDQHHSATDALRSSKLRLMKRPAYRHPFYWAPFVLISTDNE
ncbi:MAG TPA: CHAT domain-containing tetratricopeptide repeat protein [Thermoanaerobaculia bacterium]|jgi:CHAT domain-containing protein|nr:CHAT domain-containing tetratricopeptide repeat protein [Thermoanaerobaculia bacterium]